MTAVTGAVDQAVTGDGLDVNTLAEFAARRRCTSAAALQLSIQPLRGLQSLAVARVTASTTPAAGQRRTFNSVVKRVDRAHRREAGLYADLLQPAEVTTPPAGGPWL